MAVNFLQITDSDMVRSVLGIDETDVSDALICNMNPEEDLEADLLTWAPTYATIITEGLTSSPTTVQRLKLLKLRLYCKYFIAAMVASGGQNSILQKESDGANEAVRFTNVKLSKLQEDIQKKVDSLKEELELLIDPDSGVGFSLFGSVSPAYDPVTNE